MAAIKAQRGLHDAKQPAASNSPRIGGTVPAAPASPPHEGTSAIGSPQTTSPRAPNPHSSSGILLSGNLKLKSSSMFKGYSDKFFVLKSSGLLLYYSKAKDFEVSPSSPKGQVLLVGVRGGAEGKVTVTQNKSYITIRVVGDKDLLIQAKDEDEAKQWTTAINDLIS